MNDDFVLYCLYWQIIVKLQPNLYSEDTCLSPEGVPWREVPLYTRDPVPPGFHTSLRFPDQVLSGDLFGWRGCWGYGWFPDRSLLFTVLLCLPTAQALYITAGSLVALYNGQCMMTCITKMISDRRWQRGLLQLWARFLSFPSVSILVGSLETFKKIKGRFQSTLSKWWIKELHCSYIP